MGRKLLPLVSFLARQGSRLKRGDKILISQEAMKQKFWKESEPIISKQKRFLEGVFPMTLIKYIVSSKVLSKSKGQQFFHYTSKWLCLLCRNFH